MSKILVVGAKGMLGQDLCQILKSLGHTVIGTDRTVLDVTAYEQVENVLTKERPDIVINCAAYTNVDNAENDLETAKKVNVGGTENLAKVCSKNDVLLVYISTDYVFDGTKNAKYLSTDKPNPINNYGLTKFEGEKVVQKYCKKYYICRTSWLYGEYGKNFVETMLQLSENLQELNVVDDQMGCPTWTVDLSYMIGNIIAKNLPYGIYHTCGGGSTTWYEFAKEIFKQFGINVKVNPCKTQALSRPAKRPKYSVMDNGGFGRDWKLALKDYVKNRKLRSV